MRRARPHHPDRGLTLIEIMVSLALVAVLFGAAVMGVGALTGSKARSFAGTLAGTIRSLYDTASLTGNTCRLVFQLPARDKDAAGAVKYWAECAKGAVTTGMDRDQALREENRRREDAARHGGPSRPTLSGDLAGEERRVEDAVKFSGFSNEDIEPQMVSGISLSVWTRHQHEPVRNGVAYLYFFPQGYTERAQIYVRQGSNIWTILVAPLTGKTTVVPGELEVPRS